MVHLADDSSPKELVFLLGAGASFDAGLPLATDLTSNIERDIEDSYPSLLPVIRYIEGAIQFGRGSQGEKTYQFINIEDIITACNFLANRTSHYVYPYIGSWHEKILELEEIPKGITPLQTGHFGNNSFEFLVNVSLSWLGNWLNLSEDNDIKYLEDLVTTLSPNYKLHFFSLNYDETIEQALTNTIGEVNDNWTVGFDEVGWHPDLYLSEDYQSYVYKLHGSLDWVNDELLQICSRKWPSAKDSETLPEDILPLLIFGADNKVQAVDPFLTLIYHFRRKLASNNLLIIIGYSFGDPHINDILIEALQNNTQMRCIVLNPRGLNALPPQIEFEQFKDNRFIELKLKTREAINDNSLFDKIDQAIQTTNQEKPF